MSRYSVALIGLMVWLALVLAVGPGLAREKSPTLRELKQAVQNNPTDPRAYFNLGREYEAQGKPKEAAKAYSQAISLKPDYAEAYHNLARVKGDQGNYDEAIKILKKALKLKPDYKEARVLLAKEYTGQGLALGQEDRWEAAADAFQEAIKSDPEAQAPRNNLGVAYVKENRLEDAVAAFKQALEKNPDSPEAHYNLALLYFATGNHEAAYVEAAALKGVDPGMAQELSQYRFRIHKSPVYTGPPMKTVPGPFFIRGVEAK